MKRALYFFLILLTGYLAGMYHSVPLAALGLAELILAALLWVQAHLFRSRLSARFRKKSEEARVGERTVCSVVLHNKGRFPVNRARVRIRQLSPLRQVKRLYGSVQPGETELHFFLTPKFCGPVTLRLDQVRAYDDLSLFFSARAMKKKMDIAVFPGDEALSLSLTEPDWGDGSGAGTKSTNHPGDAHHEIRQIREYRTGDSSRHIHWNQSAKTDRLWIREYEREANSEVEVLADLKGLGKASPREKDAFYRLLSALVLGLLGEVTAVRVHWLHQKSAMQWEVTNRDQCRDMLYSLYQAKPEDQAACPEPSGERFFRLTADLRLFAGAALLHQFSLKTLQEELQTRRFII